MEHSRGKTCLGIILSNVRDELCAPYQSQSWLILLLVRAVLVLQMLLKILLMLNLVAA
jgi:hypothetical protein